MMVANTIQVKQELQGMCYQKVQGGLNWSHMSEAGQKILKFNLQSRHTEVSF